MNYEALDKTMIIIDETAAPKYLYQIDTYEDDKTYDSFDVTDPSYNNSLEDELKSFTSSSKKKKDIIILQWNNIKYKKESGYDIWYSTTHKVLYKGPAEEAIKKYLK